MALPTTRQEFKDYCLRSAGDGMIDINMTPEQIDDKVDDALQFWWDYHYDATSRVFISHELTQTDVDNKYIPVPDSIIGVSRVFPIQGGVYSSFGILDQAGYYHYNVYNYGGYGRTDMTGYYIYRQNISLYESLFSGHENTQYNRHYNRLTITMSEAYWKVGNFISYEATEKVDPDLNPDVWKDRWLREYATALIKYQFYYNLSKYTNVQMPGGVTTNATEMRLEAKEEKERLEQDLIDQQTMPIAVIR